VTLSLHGRIRGLFRLQKKRACPRRGPKPRIGGHVSHGDFRMTIQAGFSDELWEWLMGLGWRELVHRPERRHYRELPAPCVTELIDATEQDRLRVLCDAVARASFRPILGDPEALPPYVVRH